MCSPPKSPSAWWLRYRLQSSTKSDRSPVAPAIAVCCPVIVKPAAATPALLPRLLALLRRPASPSLGGRTFVTTTTRCGMPRDQPACRFLRFIGPRVSLVLRSRLAPGTRCALGTADPRRSSSIQRQLDRIIDPLGRAAIITRARFASQLSGSSCTPTPGPIRRTICHGRIAPFGDPLLPDRSRAL